VTSAIDTNVLIALLSGTETESDAANRSLTEAASDGALVICPAVYAELMATPGLDEEELNTFLEDTDVEVDWGMRAETWKAAGRAFRSYARRRRKQKGDDGPRRILADFLIGAHASAEANRVLTLDPQLYKANFEALEVIVPRPA
jgi:predicted nucleic acid-binding protein